MPNHFHFLLLEDQIGGIARFIQKLTNSYTKYFNVRRERTGSLFQGTYKSVFVDSNKQLLHLSRYIHINPLASNLVDHKGLLEYPWFSLLEYIDGDKKYKKLCDSTIILDQFTNIKSYVKFVLTDYRDGKDASVLKKLTLDDDFGWY